MQNPKIGIIGGKGKMGAYFAKFFTEQNFQVLISDIDTPLSNLELAQKADIVIISVPIEHTVKVIKEIAPHVRKESLLMDLTSIKEAPVEAMLKSQASVVGCHPLFAPTVPLKNQIIVLSQSRGKKWHTWIKNLFKKNGVIVKELTPQKHDELMTVIQSLTHFTDITLAHSLAQSGVSIKSFLEYQSPAYRLKLDMMGRILNQDAGLYGNMQIQNPKTIRVLKQYLNSVKTLIKIVKQKNLKKFIQYFEESADYLGDFKSKAQTESDQLIEFLNYSKEVNPEQKQLNQQNSKSKLNKKYTIVTLGPANSYSDLTSKKYNPEAKIYYTQSIREVFELVKAGKIKQGIVPIENKIEGSVRETMDLLFDTNLKIVQKLVLPIRHCLAVLPHTEKTRIQKIMSHTQALNQCERYLQKHYPRAEILTTKSSSEAMHFVLEKNLQNTAAIGSEVAANELKLKILAKNIGDEKENETHFYVIEKVVKQKLQVMSKNTQTSIAFYFDADTHGTLFGVLQEFAKAKINLTRIESRPAGQKMGNYIFYLDFDGNLQDKKIITVLEKIEQKVSNLKILGGYKMVILN